MVKEPSLTKKLTMEKSAETVRLERTHRVLTDYWWFSLLLYVTIAKQIISPFLDFILAFYTDCPFQSFVCCGLEYIFTILKFLQVTFKDLL